MYERADRNRADDAAHPGRRFRAVFPGVAKPLIAMAHVPALPGTPLYDDVDGIAGLVRHVKRDVAVLVDAGFDAVMFCNENDRPYTLKADLVASAVMARVVTECIPDAVPFGVDYLWDAECALAAAIATDARFMREVVTGAWESDMGLWTPDAAGLLRRRRHFGAEGLAVLMNVTPEFASSVGRRSPAEVARTVAVSSLPDAILVSGPMAGAEPSASTVAEVRNAVPADLPVLLNTGAKADNIAAFLEVADGCIVGSALKVDGYTWNPVDPDRAAAFVRAARGA
ncbi:MAG TPA: BtpA/SgcQ family protein [Acidimicrobiales bacterium]|nr:BtpA/SgcQ family protein [Acidimicrobiales bacterium]